MRAPHWFASGPTASVRTRPCPLCCRTDPSLQSLGWSPLQEAIWGWHSACVCALLEAGASQAADDVRSFPRLSNNLRSKKAAAARAYAARSFHSLPQNGFAPLHDAARTGNEEALRALLAAGGALEERDSVRKLFDTVSSHRLVSRQPASLRLCGHA